VGREDKSRGEDLGTRGLRVGLVAECNSLVLVGGNVSSDHRRKEETVVVGRVDRGDLAVDLSLGSQCQDSGGGDKEGGSTHPV